MSIKQQSCPFKIKIKKKKDEITTLLDKQKLR